MILKSYLACWLVICLAMLPCSQALASQPSTSELSGTGVAKNDETGLTDEKKEVISEASGSVEVSSDTQTDSRQSTAQETGEPAAVDENDEGLSTLQWVGIGAGAAALAIGIAAVAKSSSDSGPSYPAEEDIVGSWRGQGTSLADSRTYDGTYTFYAGGRHTYNLLLSDGDVHRGNGTWFLTAKSYAFELHNATGTAYRGNFTAENFASVTLTTADGRWQVTLTKR